MDPNDTPKFDMEICRLISASRGARELAESGRSGEGRRVLCAGFERARQMAAEGAPQGLDLVHLWKAAILEYVRH